MTDTQNIIPSSPEDKQKLSAVIVDISNAMTMIEAKRDYIKEAKKALKEDFELSAKQLTKIIKMYHEQSYQKEFEEVTDTFDMYVELFGEETDG